MKYGLTKQTRYDVCTYYRQESPPDIVIYYVHKPQDDQLARDLNNCLHTGWCLQELEDTPLLRAYEHECVERGLPYIVALPTLREDGTRVRADSDCGCILYDVVLTLDHIAADYKFTAHTMASLMKTHSWHYGELIAIGGASADDPVSLSITNPTAVLSGVSRMDAWRYAMMYKRLAYNDIIVNVALQQWSI